MHLAHEKTEPCEELTRDQTLACISQSSVRSSACLSKARLEPVALTPRLFTLDEIEAVFFGKELERHAANLDQQLVRSLKNTHPRTRSRALRTVPSETTFEWTLLGNKRRERDEISPWMILRGVTVSCQTCFNLLFLFLLHVCPLVLKGPNLHGALCFSFRCYRQKVMTSLSAKSSCCH